MTYAHRKDIYDADTHMMEHPNWIYDFADKDIREHLEPIVEGNKEAFDRINQALENFALRQSSPACLLYTSPSPRDRQKSRMPSSA